MAERPVSTQATSGAGTIFEYRVAAIMLGRLLRGAHVPVGTAQQLAGVGLQRRNAGYPLDDIVAHTSPRGTSLVAPTIQIQVKVSLQIATKDEDVAFVKVIGAAINACRTHRTEVRDGAMLLGLAVGEDPGLVLPDLVYLADKARGHASPESFEEQFLPGAVSRKRRTLYESVSAAVATAAATDDPMRVLSVVHEVLGAMHIWHASVGHDGIEWRSELDALADIASGAGITASDLLNHLCKLAEAFAEHGGLVDAAHVRRELLSRYSIHLAPPEAGRQGRSGGLTVNIGQINGPVYNGEVMNIYGHRLDH
ncbi:MAG TPA: hypothetical protein VFI65_15785 [Streptosporangiaceae bacterium]|nr:hypothetical protein [Streptosporangiaceae bacterium]